MKSDVIDIDGAVEARTDKAVLFHTDPQVRAVSEADEHRRME